jgi:hypothetical protein
VYQQITKGRWGKGKGEEEDFIFMEEVKPINKWISQKKTAKAKDRVHN